MVSKFKKMICIVFFVCVVKDICDCVKYLIENDTVRLDRFLFYKTEFTDNYYFYNISIIYFVGVTIVYFFMNFFKKEYKTY